MPSGQDVLPPLETASTLEWLLADGLGGTASGPVSGPPTRRSQALLTAAGAHGRLTTLLLRFDERATVESAPFELGADGTVPRGVTAAVLESFVREPWPTWRFRLGGAVIEKSVFAIHRHAAVVVSWRPISGPAVRLAVSPLVVARDPLGLQHETTEMRGATQGVPGRVQIETLPGSPALTLWHNGTFLPARLWKRGLRHPLDADGSATEDAFIPGHVEATLAAGSALQLVASSENDLFRALATGERLGVPPPRSLGGCVAALETEARERDRRWLTLTLAGADFTARQAASAHGGDGATIARRREPLVGGDDVVAVALLRQIHAGLTRRGGRLTMIGSLPLGAERGDVALRAAHALVTARAFEPAREVIRGYLDYLDEGVAPQGFDPDDGSPRYGDAAPSLWLVSAAEFYVRRSGDAEFLKTTALPALEGVMQAYRSGTRHGIRVDSDGLLATGEGAATTKRADLNALWYHALIAMAQLARHAGRREGGAFYLAWARDHQTRFNEVFWDDTLGVVREIAEVAGAGSNAGAGNGAGAGMGRGATAPARAATAPSQILAAALAPAVLSQERAIRLLERMERERLTPLGLRDSPGSERVTTEWLGPFLLAWLRTHQRSDDARARVRTWLAPLLDRLVEGAPGIPEGAEAPADGADGRTPRIAGDPSSVLAAADLLRVWIEELDRPGAN